MVIISIKHSRFYLELTGYNEDIFLGSWRDDGDVMGIGPEW